MPENARRSGGDDIVAGVAANGGNGGGNTRSGRRIRWALGAGLLVLAGGPAPLWRAHAGTPVVVAIDPGHGGTNLGAPGPGRGVFEKAVTLALAKRLRVLLTTELLAPDGQRHAASPDGEPAVPPISVVLCRDSDTLVPIRARARCAAESGARVFLSLHANAVPPGAAPGSRHGFEVFVLSPGEVDDDAALASLTNPNPTEAAWAAHEVRAAAEQSIELGRVLAAHLARVSEPAARNVVRQSGAALDVLRGAGTAAVLVEVGFMDHPEEGTRLGDPAGREPIARALADAVRQYLASPRGVAAAIQRTESPPNRNARR